MREPIEAVRTLTDVLANLRHAYTNAKGGHIGKQESFADGLLAPQIKALERLQAQLSDPAYRLVKVEDVEKALELAGEAGYDYMRTCASNLAATEFRRLNENQQRCMKEARALVGLSEEEG